MWFEGANTAYEAMVRKAAAGGDVGAAEEVRRAEIYAAAVAGGVSDEQQSIPAGSDMVAGFESRDCPLCGARAGRPCRSIGEKNPIFASVQKVFHHVRGSGR